MSSQNDEKNTDNKSCYFWRPNGGTVIASQNPQKSRKGRCLSKKGYLCIPHLNYDWQTSYLYPILYALHIVRK